MEYNDIYDARRNLTGKTHRRGTPWRKGEYGLVVCVWVYDGEGNVLMTRRAPEKSFPGTWENSGGAARAGENSLQAIVRELYEETGRRANPETKASLYDNDASVWYGGDTIAAAIGQSENRFTPLQLCSYTCALANQGVRYEATFLRRVLSADYDQLIVENEPTIASQLEISDLAYETIIEGMNMSTYIYNGTSNTVFADYGMKVCAKTGTAEHGSGGSDNGSFVLFAPADDPVIAIAIYVEKGAQGGNLGNIAKAILDAYFSESNSVDTVPYENTLN